MDGTNGTTCKKEERTLSREYQEKIKPIKGEGIKSLKASIERFSRKATLSEDYGNKKSFADSSERVDFFKERLCRRIKVTPCKNCGLRKLTFEFRCDSIMQECQSVVVRCKNCGVETFY